MSLIGTLTLIEMVSNELTKFSDLAEEGQSNQVLELGIVGDAGRLGADGLQHLQLVGFFKPPGACGRRPAASTGR